MNSPSEKIRSLVQTHDFALLGITPAGLSDHGQEIRQWIQRKFHGEMAYLGKNLDSRLDPCRLLPDARSIICVADRYDTHSRDATASPGQGSIARYAQSRDYHQRIKKRLHRIADELACFWPSHAFRCAVDTAPILERQHAQRAGLGWIGKNTMLIHPRLGSYFLLGEILTTLPLPPADLPDDKGIPNHCGTCTRCLEACPTQCLTPYHLEARRCISYLTLEHRSDIDPSLEPMMGHWIAGCDICQQVCPHNRPRGLPPLDEPPSADAPLHPPSWDLMTILNWTAADRQQALIGSALKRIKLEQFKRNALIAAGNQLVRTGDRASPLHQAIERLAQSTDESELVRLTARRQLARLAVQAAQP